MAEPVDLSLAKQHLEYEDDDRDDLIEQYISAAAGWVEGYTGLLLTRRPVMRRIADCSDGYDVGVGPDPVIDSVTYLDTDYVEQTVDDADYLLVGSRLYPKASWPSSAYGLEVAVTAGFDGDIPADLISAQLLMIGHLFESRDVNAEPPVSARMLAMPYCIMAL